MMPSTASLSCSPSLLKLAKCDEADQSLHRFPVYRAKFVIDTARHDANVPLSVTAASETPGNPNGHLTL
jgi:hypothetical protein